MSPGVASPLPRVVPSTGATLAGKHIPIGVSIDNAAKRVLAAEDICRASSR